MTTPRVVERPSEPLPPVSLQLLCGDRMRTALREYNVGQVMGELLGHHPRLTQEDLARAAGYSQSYVSRLVSGRERIADIQQIQRVVAGLGIDPDLLGPGAAVLDQVVCERPGGRLFEATPQRTVEDMGRLVTADWARRKVLAALPIATGATLVEPLRAWAHIPGVEPVGEGMISDEVARIEAATRRYQQDHMKWGATLGHRVVGGHLTQVLELLERRHPEPVTNRLFACAAGLALRMGWLTFDAGRPGLAQRYLVLALRASKDAGDKALGGYILSGMAKHLMQLGHPRVALSIVHLAQYGAKGVSTPALDAYLTSDEARARAALPEPDVTRVRRAKDLAWTFAADLDPANEPWYLRFLSRDIVAGATAIAVNRLAAVDGGYADEAAELAQASLRDPQARFPRSRAFALIEMSNARLHQREPEEAARLGRLAVESAAKIESHTVTARLRDAARQASERYPAIPAIREYAEAAAGPA